jgi:hypothetical protein
MRANLQKHRLFAAGTLTLLAALLVGVALWKPPASRAFTLVETPSETFGPVAVAAGQSALLCSFNFGNDTLMGRMSIKSFADGSVLVSEPVQQAPGMGLCLPAVQVPAGITNPAGGGIVIGSINWPVPNPAVVSSLQVMDMATGKVQVFVPSTRLSRGAQ